MPRLDWSDLEAIYAVTKFEADETGSLTIQTQKVLNALLLIEGDEDAAADAGMTFVLDLPKLEMGVQVQLQLNSPRTSLGRFVRDFASLIAGPRARVEEPKNYFVVEGRLTAQSDPPSLIQIKYRSILRLVSLFKEAAAYLDDVQQELVFFRNGKIAVPVDYSLDEVNAVLSDQVEALVGQFEDRVHIDQRLVILSEAIIDLAAALPTGQRFPHLLREVTEISDRVASGYKLFASSFSYSKIRKEVESAQADFLLRIHKTFVDLQGQMLGIPIATIVVASQLKVAKACGAEVWTNIAVVSGAWIFAAFLVASVVNQWMTLGAISFEFGRQQQRLLSDFADVSDGFEDAFDQLNDRALWHRRVFILIGIVAVVGAAFATWVAGKLIEVDPLKCF